MQFDAEDEYLKYRGIIITAKSVRVNHHDIACLREKINIVAIFHQKIINEGKEITLSVLRTNLLYHSSINYAIHWIISPSY